MFIFCNIANTLIVYNCSVKWLSSQKVDERRPTVERKFMFRRHLHESGNNPHSY